MVANVTRMMSTVDNKVNDAIWVIRKLLQGVVNSSLSELGFVAVECIEVANEPAICIG
jgi:hypothetical protein